MTSHGKSTTSIHRYLTKCLDKHNFLPLDSPRFQPNISTKTQGVVTSLLSKFSSTLSNVLPTLSPIPGKLITRVTTPTKIGSYLETVLSNMESVAPLAPDSEHIKQQLTQYIARDDTESLYELCNRNHKLLYGYWKLHNAPPKYSQDLYSFFCSPEVLTQIETSHRFTRSITTTYHNNLLELSITGKRSTDVSGQLVKDLLARCFCMMGLVNHIKGETFKISIWLTDDKKRLQYRIIPSERYLGVRNVNSGCTIRDEFSQNIGRISIWRREECEKVLVHELIHAIQFDFYDYPDDYNNRLFRKFNISKNTNINLFESYTELWTVVFSSVMFSIMRGRGSWEPVRRTLLHETRFSFFQLAKIIDYFEYDSYGDCDFFCREGFTKTAPRRFQQGSSILAYYIIKTALLYNLDGFLHYCITFNSKLEPWRSRGADLKLWEIIEKSLECRDFISTAERSLRQFRRCKYQCKGDMDAQFNLVTLRMTCTG